MTTIVQASEVDLNYLEEKFQLHLTTDNQFFPESRTDLPELTDLEKQALARVTNNFLNLVKFRPMLEEAVKMVVLSPLLDLAGFYQHPFRITTEQFIEVAIEDKDEVIRGRMDVVVLRDQFYILIIESKQVGLSLELGIPQVLAYMLGSRFFPCLGFVTNGSNFIFTKLEQEKMPVYALSDEFTLRRNGDLEKVLGILKRLAGQFYPTLISPS